LLSLNLAVWIQIVVFILLVLICGPLLIRPTMRLIEERRRRNEGARSRAKEIEEENEARLGTIEETLGTARTEGNAEREEIRMAKVQRAESLMADAREEARKEIEAMRRRIEEEMEKARKTLKAEIETLARDIAARLLGREVA